MAEAMPPPPPSVPPDPTSSLPGSFSPDQFYHHVDVVMSDLPSSSPLPQANQKISTTPSEKGVLGAAPSCLVRDNSSVPQSVSTGTSSPPVSKPRVSDTGFNWAKNLTSAGKIPISSAPVSISVEGRPRVKVPNDVFDRGAKLHEDFIVGIFYGKAPSYGKICGVLNFLWGKDKRVTVHNLTKNAFLFYVPSPSLRKRVLQQELWHVGDSPFFVTAWKSEFSYNPPSLERALVWASIKDIPFDLITPEGLSIICRPLGRAVDHKPFTSINSAEVKIIVDLMNPLPPILELEREDGQVLFLKVTYPWLPPLCPLCNELGHKASLCPTTAQSERSSSRVVKEKNSPDGPAEKLSTSHVEKKQVWKPVPSVIASSVKGNSVDMQASMVQVKDVTSTYTQEIQIPSLRVQTPSELDIPINGNSQIFSSGPKSTHILPNIVSAGLDVTQTGSDQLVNHTIISSASLLAAPPPITTSNRFDMLSVEENSTMLYEDSSSMVLFGSSSSSSSSSKGKKTKRKRYDLLSPAPGGILSVQGEKRHSQ